MSTETGDDQSIAQALLEGLITGQKVQNELLSADETPAETPSNQQVPAEAAKSVAPKLIVSTNKQDDEITTVSQQIQPPRKRGRPRKDMSKTPLVTPGTRIVSRPNKGKAPDKCDPDFVPTTATSLTPGIRPSVRANRGKPPVKFEPELESKKRRPSLIPGEPPIKKRRGPGRPPKSPVVIKQEPEDEDEAKENKPVAEKSSENPGVTVNLTVQDRRCVPYLDQMGVYVVYYCRKCIYHSKQMSDVTKHLASGNHLPVPKRGPGRRSEAAIEASASAKLDQLTMVELEDSTSEKNIEMGTEVDVQAVEGDENEENEAKPRKPWNHWVRVQEHNYAEVTVKGKEGDDAEHSDDAEIIDDSEEDETDGKKDEEEEEEDLSPRKWFCDECHYTTFYSPIDFAEHKRCHGKAGKATLHCWRCKEDGKRNILKGFEWHRLKVHLSSCHDVNFKICCDKCSEMFTSHGRFRRHYRSHRIKCKHEFCKFDADAEDDMTIHLKCHREDDPKHFKCFLCEYECKNRPWKWSTMHNHLVTQHPGNISPLYQCESCNKGFQEIRRYTDHKKHCGHDKMMECELCGKVIYKSKFMSHALWHVKKEQDEEQKKIWQTEERAASNVESGKVTLVTGAVEIDSGSAESESTTVVTNSGTQVIPATSGEPEQQTATIISASGDEITETDKAMAELLVAAARPIEMVPEGTQIVMETENQTYVLQADQLQQMAGHMVGEDGETVVAIVTEESAQQEDKQITVSTNHEVKLLHEGQAEKEESVEQTETDRQEASTEEELQQTGAPGSTDKFSIDINVPQHRCLQHNLVFPSQLAMTKHYVEVHWGISADIIKQAEEESRRQKDENGAAADMDWTDRELNIKEEMMDDMEPQRSAGIKCKHCYKRFATGARLAKHIGRAHTEEKLKRVLCQACGRDFRNRAQFRNHYRVVHEGKKRRPSIRPFRTQRKFFVCELCGYTTPESVRLRNHRLSVHEGVMPYQCDLCNYVTNEKSDMRRHKHKHAGIKRYPCEFCSYRTDQRWLLVNHCLRQHGIQMPRVTRDTRGCFWSNRRKKREEEEQQIPLQQILDIQPTEEVTVFMTQDGGTEQLAIREEEVAVEAIEQETREGGEVVYVREDGTILEPEEAALMLLAVAPVQVEKNYTYTVQ